MKPVLAALAALAVTFAGGGLSPVLAQAFQFAPMHADLKATGRAAEATFTVTNTGASPIAIEARVLKRDIAENGENIDGEEAGDFILMPTQFVVPPSQTQNIRVRWIGASEVSREQAYRLEVSQIPVSLDDPQANARKVDLAVSYLANLYVGADGLKSDLSFDGWRMERDAEGKAQLVFTAENKGSRRAVISGGDLELAVGQSRVTLKGTEGQLEALGTYTVLPGARRVLRMPWPQGLAEGAPTVRYEPFYLVQ